MVSQCVCVCIRMWFCRETVAAGVVGNLNERVCLRAGEKATSEMVKKTNATSCVYDACVCVNFGSKPKQRGQTARQENINTNTHIVSSFTHTINSGLL